MIELQNVSKYYTNNGVVTLGLRNVNLKLNKGEIVAITGDSGSGKSTLLNVITGVDTYEEGEILFQGNETSYFNQNDMDTFRKNYVSFIFQSYNIIDSYTVLENVMIPLLLAGKNHEEAKKQAKEIIEKVGLTKRLRHKGTKLSGGEKQRCVIARALASDSLILACDEPTGNLDSKTGDEIMKLIQEVAKDKLVLIVTHNYNQVKEIATRRIKVSDGEIIEDVSVQNCVEEEVEDTLTLNETKVKKSTYIKLALQNVISTPKKTIFTTIVFMVIAFIALILFLMMIQISYDTYSSINDNYSLCTKDRVIVYRMDHQPLDKKIIENVSHKEIYYNAFYEEQEIALNVDPTSDFFQSYKVKLTYHSLPTKHIDGRQPNHKDEYYLAFPETENNYYFVNYASAINKMFNIGTTNSKIVGEIVGVGASKDIKYPYLLCYKEYSSLILDEVTKNISVVSQCVLSDGNVLNLSRVYSDQNRIIMPMAYKEKEFKIVYKYAGLYEIELDLPIEYNMHYLEPTLCQTPTFLVPDLEEPYEAVIYTNQVKDVKKILEKQGYMVSIPADTKGEAGFFNLAIMYMFLGLSIMALLCLFFITYVILARVYASKNKDYGVLRTLGMVKSQLGRVVILEVITIGLISSILALLTFVIVYVVRPDIFFMGQKMGFGILCFYFIVMLLFSYFIARRFNRRLYKFSVNTTVKGEVARND